MEGNHPTLERAAAALEAAGLNPYLLLERGAVAATDYAEVRLSLARDRFALLSLEELPVPALRPERRHELHRLALGLCARWGLVWRGSIEEGRVQIAFGADVRYLALDEPDETGLRLHDAILAVHHAHQSFRRRALNAAWRAPGADAPPVPA